MLQIQFAQQFRRIGLAASIELREAPMYGITGNVCNQRLRCSGCEQSPTDTVIRVFESGNMP